MRALNIAGPCLPLEYLLQAIQSFELQCERMRAEFCRNRLRRKPVENVIDISHCATETFVIERTL